MRVGAARPLWHRHFSLEENETRDARLHRSGAHHPVMRLKHRNKGMRCAAGCRRLRRPIQLLLRAIGENRGAL